VPYEVQANALQNRMDLQKAGSMNLRPKEQKKTMYMW